MGEASLISGNILKCIVRSGFDFYLATSLLRLCKLCEPILKMKYNNTYIARLFQGLNEMTLNNLPSPVPSRKHVLSHL